MNKEESKKSLFDLLICNYDFPVEFAEDMAKFLTDEGYIRPTVGEWVARTFTSFDIEKIGFNCSKCNTTWDVPTNYCPHCGAKMIKED